MNFREFILITLLILGFGLNIASWWLIWDFIRVPFNGILKDYPNCFYLPFYFECIKYDRWSLIFDTLFTINIISLIFIVISAYFLGRFKE